MLIRLFAPVLLVASTSIYAQGFDPDAATLTCLINRSESLLVFPEQKLVVWSPFMNRPQPLNMESFEVYRCPLCYSFVGSNGGGIRYKGRTRGKLGANGVLSASMTLTIGRNRAREIPCHPPLKHD